MGRIAALVPSPRGISRFSPDIPRAYVDIPDPNAPRLPGDVPPGAADDLPDSFRDTRPPVDTGPRRITEEALPDPWRGEQVDVNLPWWRNPMNAVPAAMAAGVGGLAWLLGKGLGDTGGTADLHAEQTPLPGGPDLNDPAVRRRLMSSTEGRAMLGSPDAQEYLARQNTAENVWRAKAFLAGGSNNLHSGNHGFYNQFLTLGPQGARGLPGVDYDLSDEQQAVLQQNMPINPYRAQIEKAQLDRAAELAGKTVARQLENSVPDPVKAEAVRQQRQATQIDNYNKARKHIEANYAWPNDWLGSDFTDAEVASAIDDIATMLGIPEAEAAAIVNSIKNTYRARGR
jgi:hypothetical protein